MSKATRLKLGKMWKNNPKSRPANITDEHPYIKEYTDSIAKEKPEPKKKVK